MQTYFPHLLDFWDVITSSLLGLFPTVNKALKQYCFTASCECLSCFCSLLSRLLCLVLPQLPD